MTYEYTKREHEFHENLKRERKIKAETEKAIKKNKFKRNPEVETNDS